MAVIARLPVAVADELVRQNLASVPRARRSGWDLAIEVATNAAVVVTLVQTPETVIRLTELLREWGRRGDDEGGEEIGEVVIRTSSGEVTLPVASERDAVEVARLVRDALE